MGLLDKFKQGLKKTTQLLKTDVRDIFKAGEILDEETLARFESRLDDPVRRWKLSPMDLQSITRWEDYSRAKDDMFTMTDTPEAPWYVVDSDDKRRARINMIAHLLSTIPYHDVPEPKLKLPRRPAATGYVRTPRDMQTFVPDHAATLLSPVLRGTNRTPPQRSRGLARKLRTPGNKANLCP